MSGETYSAYLKNHIFTALGCETRVTTLAGFIPRSKIFIFGTASFMAAKTVSKELVDEIFKTLRRRPRI